MHHFDVRLYIRIPCHICLKCVLRSEFLLLRHKSLSFVNGAYSIFERTRFWKCWAKNDGKVYCNCIVQTENLIIFSEYSLLKNIGSTKNNWAECERSLNIRPFLKIHSLLKEYFKWVEAIIILSEVIKSLNKVLWVYWLS